MLPGGSRCERRRPGVSASRVSVLGVGEANTEASTKGLPHVDVVIVNWNSGAHLKACVATLDRSTSAEALHVVIVDNASTDGSTAGLEAERIGLEIVRNADNRGFAVACNQGTRKGSAPLVLFLNPDVQVRLETVELAARYMAEPANANVGALGIQLLDRDGRVQRCCARAPTLGTLLLHTLFLDRLFPSLVPPHFLIEWDHAETRPVDQVMGAFLLTRRELFERIGGMDERFFLYYEDVDLCLAVRNAGCTVVHYAGAQAAHAGGGSTEAVKDRRLSHHIVSRTDYASKHYGCAASSLLMACILLFELPIRWLHASMSRSSGEGVTVLRAVVITGKQMWTRAMANRTGRGF
jgi:N-acetylglucosaminyl-diphospho-decaprenol L-rhamnosyltransferase